MTEQTIEQLRAELAHAKIRASKYEAAFVKEGFARDALARECNKIACLVNERDAELVKRDHKHKNNAKMIEIRGKALNKARAELAQARDELKDLQVVNRECRRQLGTMKESREFWFGECLGAESERNEMRQAAQEQSDLVQREWLSPAEAEGLRQQLAKTKQQVIEWKDAWKYLAKLRYKERNATAKLLDRLATLDDAEAALANCGLTGIYDDFDGIADAIQQMVRRLVQLEGGSGLLAAAAEEQLADARRVARLWFRRAHEPMIEVEITGEEMTKALQAERAQRQVAETSERASRKMLAMQCDMARTAETEAMKAKRQLAEAEQRAERAEALAALVTERLAGLLNQLASNTQTLSRVAHKLSKSAIRLLREDTEAALKLAAQIREALDEH